MGYHKNSFNKVVLTGNIGHEPELKKTDKDVSYLRFGLATTYAFKDTEETTWHNCVAWVTALRFSLSTWRKAGSCKSKDG